MDVASRATGTPLARWVYARVLGWRTGSRDSQMFVLAVLLLGVTVSFLVSWRAYAWMPMTAYFVWLLLGMLLLRFVPLVVLAGYDSAAAVTAGLLQEGLPAARIVAFTHLGIAVLIVLYQASRQRSGLPMPLSEALLVDLKDRLQSQGQIPPLPAGWESQTAMIASHGVRYAGDFLVADLTDDRRRLEVILVDVCGKGTAAGPAALQFAGALGGLLGHLPPRELFQAANDFLLRRGGDEGFATAVHLLVDLVDGSYAITSAGHPPAMRWDLPSQEWVIDNARGLALGVLPEPELHISEGRLFPGEALMFYTDGVIEHRSTHLDVGIAWLQRVGRDAFAGGVAGAAGRIISQVERGHDDRAVLILSRDPVPAAAVTAPDVSTARG